MTKHMLIDAVHPEETRVVIADDDFIEDFDFVTSSKQQLKGNIYLAKITRVEPSLQAAFVEYGGGKQGFLPFSEIHPDYYQIPVEDKRRLIEEEEAETAKEEAEEEEAFENRSSRRARRSRGRRRGGRNRNRKDAKPSDDEEVKADSDENAEETQADGAESDSDDDTSTDYKAAENKQPEVSSGPVEEEEEEEEVEEEAEAKEAEASDETAEETTDEPEAEEKAKPKRGRARAKKKETDTEADSETDSDDDEDEEEDNVETVSSDDMEETQRRRKGSSFKRYRIQEVIKRNQIVLVQVIKEERGNKGVSLTTYISLAGRYCVLMPNSPKAGGVSRKINSNEQRKKLKEVVAELKEKRGLSAIVRTAGIDRTKAEIKRDYEYLVKLWHQIREDTLSSSAPMLIYEESDIIKRAIRDLYTNDVEHVWVQGEQSYKDAKHFMKLIMPSHAPRVKQYKESVPIFTNYGIEEQLSTMYDPSAKLPSGGYVVLHPTEALISIDVNSGRSTTERNVEETAIKTNLEAAREIARQLRLRDLAGLVVVDFIDMYYGKNRRTVERAMKDALKHDRAKIQVSRISAFGLMELSRQRLRPSIAESSTVMCPHCEGTGSIRSVETVAIQIIRLLDCEAATGEYVTLKVQTNSDVVQHLFNEKRHMIEQIEEQYGINVVVTIDTSMMTGRFRLLKVNEEGKEIVHHDGDKGSRRKGRKGNRGGRNRNKRNDDRNRRPHHSKEEADNDNTEAEETSEDTSSDEKEAAKEETDDKPKRRSSSRSRGRRKKVQDAPESDDEAKEAKSDDSSDDEEKSKPRSRGRKRTTAKKSDDSASEDKPAGKPKDKASDNVVEMTASEESYDADDSGSDDDLDDDGKPKKKRKGWWNRA